MPIVCMTWTDTSVRFAAARRSRAVSQLAVVAVAEHDQQGPSADPFAQAERAENGVAERRGAGGVRSVDRPGQASGVGRPRRPQLDMFREGQQGHAILGAQRRDDRPGGILQVLQRLPFRAGTDIEREHHVERQRLHPGGLMLADAAVEQLGSARTSARRPDGRHAGHHHVDGDHLNARAELHGGC
jgi:hypothetical protein